MDRVFRALDQRINSISLEQVGWQAFHAVRQVPVVARSLPGSGIALSLKSVGWSEYCVYT